jgi:hypothetical protein
MDSQHSEEALDIILNHPTEGKRLVIHGRDVTVQCVDRTEYSRRFKNRIEAQDARSLVAIFPSMWKKL